MSLNLKEINDEDKGIIAPCGILCLGCDAHLGEGVEAARNLIKIWEGFNILDVSQATGLNAKAIKTTLNTLKKYIKMNEKGNCPGCYINPGPPSTICGIAKCVKSKGFWTCAECEEHDPESESPCPNINMKSFPMSDKGQMSKLICARYGRNNVDNLKRCREIGYKAFIKEAREKVAKGWRTWQVISKDMVFTEAMKK
ncbi:MAG: DUF3795 domain-containing protein [Promethearchaeota archaeon]|nr:MAG: DUF3795 domain-containing protein [Candidatus Lokiarchaeota archaeon]